ncbi:MAG: hypothetical protein IPK00_14755 [Deltaproteobacteria bacterium]|nr:hypothetical protein [Deltaproteobacteria bacterium]
MRHLVVSSDCHAGLPPERYRDYLDPKYRERFDQDLAARMAQRKEAAKLFLVDEFNERWRAENWTGLTGAWDHAARIAVLDGDGIAAEVVFPDGITEFNSPPFGADLGPGDRGRRPGALRGRCPRSPIAGRPSPLDGAGAPSGLPSSRRALGRRGCARSAGRGRTGRGACASP